MSRFLRLCLGLGLGFVSGFGAMAEPYSVSRTQVLAHETYLAGDALRGRGSATPDEAKAAAYVADKFKAMGLKPAPGIDGFLQTAKLIKPIPSGQAVLHIGSVDIREGMGLTYIYTNGREVSGSVLVATSADPKALVPSEILMVEDLGKTSPLGWMRAATSVGSRLVILRDGPEAKALLARFGGQTGTATRLEGGEVGMGGMRPDLISLSSERFAQLKAMAGQKARLTSGDTRLETSVTTNAIGWLQGRDPMAGVILISAHLDHLGVRPDGVIMHGANDDASGTVAVMEIARALASGSQPRRSILFVCYGAEEIGGFGSTAFGAHPPVPLSTISANIEFEMIGAQDPKMAIGEMMMTGMERSNLGPFLQSHGALIAKDPYPDMNFFERSDNYALAKRGVVAHTISGWAVTPTYHSPNDDIAHLDIDFMTAAIQSMIAPVRELGDSDFQPKWNEGKKP